MNKNARILIIDDSPENIEVLGELLKHYDRIVATDGEKGIQLAQRKPQPDLILLDIVMPGMSGFEVCKELKRLESTKSIPIIFITSKNDRSDILKGFQIGAQDFITKPFDSRELIARVKTQLELVFNRKKLEAINDWLEEQVMLRTQELIDTNKKLINANNELRHLDASKAEFLKLISHEIRTPLNGILGFSQIIKDSVKDSMVTDMIDMLDESCKRLEDFSYRALDISTLKIKKENAIFRVKTDVVDLVNRIIEEEKNAISCKKLKINIDTVGQIYQPEVDPNFLHKGLYNLIDNAIKFSSENGEIDIELIFEDRFRFRITDQGKGFNEIMLTGLSFMASGNHVDQNPGLGLYLSALVARSHDGDLSYGNNPIKGAWVEMEFPNK